MILSQFISECVPAGYEVSLSVADNTIFCIVGFTHRKSGWHVRDEQTYGLGPGDSRRMDDIMLSLVARCTFEVSRRVGMKGELKS